MRWRPWSGRDRDPAPKKDALFARDTGRLTVVVPMQLTQSGIGVVSRLPVFPPDASDNTVFWGFTKVACRLSDLLHGVALSDLERCGYRYELWSMESPPDSRRCRSPGTALRVRPRRASWSGPCRWPDW
ncbi:MAG: hypothetical protein EBY24_19310 [Betaproteobacteria bacterium]|nr:hypothetical protein [Betaproteobacteria bacterium]